MRITSAKQVNSLFGELRRHANVTRVQLAKRLRISEGALYDRECRGQRGGRQVGLTVDALIETADVFGLDVILVRRDTGKPA